MNKPYYGKVSDEFDNLSNIPTIGVMGPSYFGKTHLADVLVLEDLDLAVSLEEDLDLEEDLNLDLEVEAKKEDLTLDLEEDLGLEVEAKDLGLEAKGLTLDLEEDLTLDLEEDLAPVVEAKGLNPAVEAKDLDLTVEAKDLDLEVKKEVVVEAKNVFGKKSLKMGKSGIIKRK
jgi:hypothetical protein